MKFALPVLVTLSALLATGIEGTARSAPGEPPLKFELEIDGVAHPLVEGTQRVIKIGDHQHQVKLRVAPHRRFAAAGIEFDFPRTMPFEFEDEDDLRTWSLNGKELTVRIYQFAAGEADEMARIMIDATTEALDKRAKVRKSKLKLAGADRVVLSCKTTVMESQMQTTTFGLQVDDKACVIMLQDNLTDDGEPSAEAKVMTELFAKTLRIRTK